VISEKSLQESIRFARPHGLILCKLGFIIKYLFSFFVQTVDWMWPFSQQQAAPLGL
jgi:hypothetical protein